MTSAIVPRREVFDQASAPAGRGRAEPLLRVEALTVMFREFVALRDVSLDIAARGVHAVIGPNGAGKSTLFNAISGFVKPTRGRVSLSGVDVTAWRADRLARLGLARSFQICSVFPGLSVEENLLMARAGVGSSTNVLRRRSASDLGPTCERLLDEATLILERKRRAGELPYGRRRLLEIVTTLALQPTLLLLDEPTAGLAREDIPDVIKLIARAAERCGVLLIEHNLQVVEQLAQRVTVLAGGSVLCEGSYEDVSCDQGVWKAYLGGPTGV
jgi:branched-chain amino acid transport system ATP-binding protein